MIWDEANGLRFGHFETLDKLKVLNRIYTRRGGVSPQPWASLNLGGMNGDSRENVIENRRRIFENIGRSPESIFDVWQVHGTEVIQATRPRPLNEEHQKADIILSDRPDLTLFMRFADCVPIFLCDPKRKVIGLVHAGWMGTVNRAAAVAVMRMCEVYHSIPDDIVAVIGPSIGPDHYEVGVDVIERVKSVFGDETRQVVSTTNECSMLNLWRSNELILQSVGVKHIEVAEICTACHTEDWFSHRQEKGLTGRFGALIALA